MKFKMKNIIIFIIIIWTFNLIEFSKLDLFGSNIVVVYSASASYQEKRGAMLTGPDIADLPSEVRVEEEEVNKEASSIEALIRKEFGEHAEDALKIAQCESRLRPEAHGDKHLTYWKDGKMYGDSIGVFQIRTFPSRPDRQLLFDPEYNIKYAKDLFVRSGWGPWTCKKVLKQ